MIRVQFLGTGAAEGIPAMQCDCEHCRRARQEGGKLRRERSCILLYLPSYTLLVDAPPNIKSILGYYGINNIDGIFISHEHYDHAGGLKEFAYWGKDIDLFTVASTYEGLEREGAFRETKKHLVNQEFRPGMAFHFDGFFLVPFAVKHSVPCFGLAVFQQGVKLIYTSDTSSVFSHYAYTLMEGADLLIVNTPGFEEAQADHINIVEAVALKHQVNAKKLVLTHFNHYNKPHDKLEEFAAGQADVIIAYDGMDIVI